MPATTPRSLVEQNHAEPVVMEPMRRGLELLWKAANYATNTGLDRWDFAVEIAELRDAGLGSSDLRWLVAKGYLQHAREVEVPDTERRSFADQHPFRFLDESCFVLTDLGVAIVRIGLVEPMRIVADAALGDERTTPDTPSPSRATPAGIDNGRLVPRWDAQRREFWIGKSLIKRYRVPAPRQEIILTVFQEEKWPSRIDDPLPPQPEIDPKRQLHATISSLNRHQKCSLIHFRGDGNGTGVLWELHADKNG